ncbi:phage holin family protein [Gemella sp. GH3]|uniref:phage holin family protein n=1 Tax=unclassified Gemella TaxID=2624949 RepID=UPI0015D01FB6|nr:MULTISPECIES: phage holin family protein [unclassified Gemella]MBF0714482.1 phage holin family protein [Gemella sp. GH3.1]NYS51434.1 phage holin family protein [Gemella sp. GH3]
MDNLQAYINFEIVAFCLLFGKIIKDSTPIKNNLIPIILGVVGILFCIGLKQELSFQVIITGLVSGWMSTGVHSVVKGVSDVRE